MQSIYLLRKAVRDSIRHFQTDQSTTKQRNYFISPASSAWAYSTVVLILANSPCRQPLSLCSMSSILAMQSAAYSLQESKYFRDDLMTSDYHVDGDCSSAGTQPTNYESRTIFCFLVMAGLSCDSLILTALLLSPAISARVEPFERGGVLVVSSPYRDVMAGEVVKWSTLPIGADSAIEFYSRCDSFFLSSVLALALILFASECESASFLAGVQAA